MRGTMREILLRLFIATTQLFIRRSNCIPIFLNFELTETVDPNFTIWDAIRYARLHLLSITQLSVSRCKNLQLTTLLNIVKTDTAGIKEIILGILISPKILVRVEYVCVCVCVCVCV